MGPVWPKRALSAAIVRSQTHVQHVAAADRVASDHGDDRLGDGSDLALQVQYVEARHPVVADVAAVAADALVAAGTERHLAGACQDDHAHGSVLVRLTEGVLQLEQRLGSEGVADLGAIDCDLGDAIGDLVENVAVFLNAAPFDRHAVLLSGRPFAGGTCSAPTLRSSMVRIVS